MIKVDIEKDDFGEYSLTTGKRKYPMLCGEFVRAATGKSYNPKKIQITITKTKPKNPKARWFRVGLQSQVRIEGLVFWRAAYITKHNVSKRNKLNDYTRPTVTYDSFYELIVSAGIKPYITITEIK